MYYVKNFYADFLDVCVKHFSHYQSIIFIKLWNQSYTDDDPNL